MESGFAQPWPANKRKTVRSIVEKDAYAMSLYESSQEKRMEQLDISSGGYAEIKDKKKKRREKQNEIKNKLRRKRQKSNKEEADSAKRR
jgi:hypothetical protein